MEIKENCLSRSNDTKIKCEEKSRKIVFTNTKKLTVDKILVDGCQITDGSRFDYLIKLENREYFVELKGQDLRHAFEQLKNSITLLGQSTCLDRSSYVISSRSPLASSEIQVARLRFLRYYKSDLIVKNNNLKVNL